MNMHSNYTIELNEEEKDSLWHIIQQYREYNKASGNQCGFLLSESDKFLRMLNNR